jgi:hypothetical protein
MKTLVSILEGEFFWGIVIGTVLAVLGSLVTAWLHAQFKKSERVEIVHTFASDTVMNLLQIMRDLEDLRGRTNAIQHDFLALLDVELNVFGRNREYIIHLPPQTRERLRKFVNAVAIRRAEIGNWLTGFYQQMTLADQLTASGQSVQAQQVIAAASANQLARATTAADRLYQLVPDGYHVLKLLGSQN